MSLQSVIEALGRFSGGQEEASLATASDMMLVTEQPPQQVTVVARFESIKHLLSDTPPLRPNRTRPLARVLVIIHDAEEGGYWAEVPSLPGCVSEGETVDETLANVREALEGVLLSYKAAKERIPWEQGEPSEPGGQTHWLDVDLESLM